MNNQEKQIEAIAALVEDYETDHLSQEDLINYLSPDNTGTEQLKYVFSLVYAFIVHYYLPNIAVSDYMYKRVKKKYKPLLAVQLNLASSKLPSDLQMKLPGVKKLHDRMPTYFACEHFWWELLTNLASNNGFDFSEALRDTADIERFDSETIDQLIIPDAFYDPDSKEIIS